jgi:hypothetical protein
VGTGCIERPPELLNLLFSPAAASGAGGHVAASRRRKGRTPLKKTRPDFPGGSLPNPDRLSLAIYQDQASIGVP